jgi:hypothetical protein
MSTAIIALSRLHATTEFPIILYPPKYKSSTLYHYLDDIHLYSQWLGGGKEGHEEDVEYIGWLGNIEPQSYRSQVAFD